jgi:hypothetical protein
MRKIKRTCRLQRTLRACARSLSIFAALQLVACGNSERADVSDSASLSRTDLPANVAMAAMRTAPLPKSPKRGIAYDLADPRDFAVLAPGVSWWYNWSPQPNRRAPRNSRARYGMDFYPMVWGPSIERNAIQSYLGSHRRIRYLLVLNEPNITDESNLTPQAAAELWSSIESLARASGVSIVGPAMTWGSMAGYADPVAWLDAFYESYRARHGRDPRIDYLAFHWYDYGLAEQLDRLTKYGKRFWVTEFANWHSGSDGDQIDTPQRQARQMADMVETCEARDDVMRYAWFIGRWSPDPHYTSLLGPAGELTAMGRLYLALPFAAGLKE